MAFVQRSLTETDYFESNYISNFYHYLKNLSPRLNTQRAKSHKSPKVKFINSESKILNKYKNAAISFNLYLKYQYKITSKSIEQNKHGIIDDDNLIREVLESPIIGLKNYFEKKFKIKLTLIALDNKLFKYKLKQFIKLKLYQLINFDLEYKNIFINDRQLIYYFMSMTYEQLFNYYINNINISNFNDHDINIPNFQTISKVIDHKKSELKKKGKTEGYINMIIEKFKKKSENIIENIKKGNLDKEETVDKMIIKVTVKKNIKNIMNKLNK